jgi:hypothetical protein
LSRMRILRLCPRARVRGTSFREQVAIPKTDRLAGRADYTCSVSCFLRSGTRRDSVVFRVGSTKRSVLIF